MSRAYIILAAVAVVLLFCMAAPAGATEEYARKTGWECRVCHVNPLGGGELTPSGESFKAAMVSAGTYRPLRPFERAVRLLVGYLHILAGVVWFGAIFYVHILLKPAYAAKGLPKGELVLGWAGIVITGVTGALLAAARMPSFGAFLDTRFGVLLTIKIALYLLMAGSAAIVTFVLGPKMRKRMLAQSAGAGDMTAEVLKGFDGKDGRRAYVAVDGVIYDVTESRLWKNGKHTRHLAGDDLTAALAQAPHGMEKLEPLPRVGRLVEGGTRPPADRPKAVFYFFAYMNLIFVFLILGVIALWRWW